MPTSHIRTIYALTISRVACDGKPCNSSVHQSRDRLVQLSDWYAVELPSLCLPARWVTIMNIVEPHAHQRSASCAPFQLACGRAFDPWCGVSRLAMSHKLHVIVLHLGAGLRGCPSAPRARHPQACDGLETPRRARGENVLETPCRAGCGAGMHHGHKRRYEAAAPQRHVGIRLHRAEWWTFGHG